jgi:hypothetical protein
MTIELVKEQKLNDSLPIYFIKLNGKFVDGTITKKLEEATDYYDKIYNNPRIAVTSETILKCEEIVIP